MESLCFSCAACLKKYNLLWCDVYKEIKEPVEICEDYEEGFFWCEKDTEEADTQLYNAVIALQEQRGAIEQNLPLNLTSVYFFLELAKMYSTNERPKE